MVAVPYASVAEYKKRLRLRNVIFDESDNEALLEDLLAATAYIEKVTGCEFGVAQEPTRRLFRVDGVPYYYDSRFPIHSIGTEQNPQDLPDADEDFSAGVAELPCPASPYPPPSSRNAFEDVESTDQVRMLSLPVASTRLELGNVDENDFTPPDTDSSDVATYINFSAGLGASQTARRMGFYLFVGIAENTSSETPAFPVDELRIVIRNVHLSEDDEIIFGHDLKPFAYSSDTYWYIAVTATGNDRVFNPSFAARFKLKKLDRINGNLIRRNQHLVVWVREEDESEWRLLNGARFVPQDNSAFYESPAWNIGAEDDEWPSLGGWVGIEAYWGWPKTPPDIVSACIEHAALNRVEGPHATSELSPLTGFRYEPSKIAQNIFQKYMQVNVNSPVPFLIATTRYKLTELRR